MPSKGFEMTKEWIKHRAESLRKTLSILLRCMPKLGYHWFRSQDDSSLGLNPKLYLAWCLQGGTVICIDSATRFRHCIHYDNPYIYKRHCLELSRLVIS
jgi:hypothetical protein